MSSSSKSVHDHFKPVNTQIVNNFYAESEKLLFEYIDRALGASIDNERKRHRTVISIVTAKPRAALVAVERWIRRAPDHVPFGGVTRGDS